MLRRERIRQALEALTKYLATHNTTAELSTVLDTLAALYEGRL